MRDILHDRIVIVKERLKKERRDISKEDYKVSFLIRIDQYKSVAEPRRSICRIRSSNKEGSPSGIINKLDLPIQAPNRK